MKPEIYAGDCFEVLAELGPLDGMVAAVITDPPYSSGARLEARKSTSGAMVRGARFPTPIENDQMTTAGINGDRGPQPRAVLPRD